MFSGIVAEVGTVEKPVGRDRLLTVRAPQSVGRLEVSGSVAVNGVCLTAVEVADGSFSCNAVAETLSRSNLGQLQEGDRVNLELPLNYGDPVGGHLVQGHVDGTAEVIGCGQSDAGDGSYLFRFLFPQSIIKYVVLKGYVAIDGASLTVAGLDGCEVSVAVIPYTYRNTVMRFKQPGDFVNVEAEMNAKYIERIMVDGRKGSKI